MGQPPLSLFYTMGATGIDWILFVLQPRVEVSVAS